MMMERIRGQIGVGFRAYGVTLILLTLLVQFSFRSFDWTQKSSSQSHAINGRIVNKRQRSIQAIDMVPGGPESESDFQLALQESLGFFTDIPAHTWQTLKTSTNNVVDQHSKTATAGTEDGISAQTYYERYWDPEFSCSYETSIGVPGSDGEKWVCDPHRLTDREDCLVYSIGSNGNFDFEEDVHRRLPNCEIHIFDPTDHSQGMWNRGLNGSNFHAWGLESSYGQPIPSSNLVLGNTAGLRFMSLPKTMEVLGHVGRRIDILKIDCEGCEWSTYKDVLEQDIRQVLVEVHFVNDLTEQYFKAFHDEGYVIFHKEPNVLNRACVEFAFLKLAKEFLPVTSIA